MSWTAARVSGRRTRRSGVGWLGSATPGSGHATSRRPTPSARKRRRIRRPIPAPPRRGVARAEDETDLLLFPPLRAGWAPRGEPAEVWLAGGDARRVVFGAMD